MNPIAFLHHTRFETKPVIEMLLETPFSKEIRICMGEGVMMREHTAPNAITIMVLEGSVTIESLGSSVCLTSGDTIYFDPKVPHSLHATLQSVVRLTLAKTDTLQRVLNVGVGVKNVMGQS
jgi:quercetin dioxygenase-like cupin family protein